MSTNAPAATLHHIVIPVDGTPWSFQAIPYALKLAAHARHVTFLKVITSAGLAGEEGLTRLEALRRTLAQAHPGTAFFIEMAYGEPVEEILRVASRTGADFIVMATHDTRRSVDRPVTESISGQVASMAHIPVMVIHSTAGADERSSSAVRRIVVPQDGSLRAARCLPVAARLARILEVPVHLVTVIDATQSLPPAYAYSCVECDEDRFDALRNLQFQGDEALRHAERELRCAGIAPTAELLAGPTVQSLLDTLQPDDLLVLATRGAGQTAPSRFGSVALRLLRETNGSVVMFQPETPIISMCATTDWESTIAEGLAHA